MAYIGVDVGTGSVRAGVFDASGHLLGAGRQEVTLHRGPGTMVEQSSAEIWSATCTAVRAAMAEAALQPSDISGLGFDATCSLLVLDESGAPLPVGPSEDPERNIIVWMDHRAIDQASRINTTKHPVLEYVGGRISPEMQTPKLLWLKENRPEVFEAAAHFFDLSDYLGWRATGAATRSVCTVVCKWTYLAHEARWDPTYFETIGLTELTGAGVSRIGDTVVAPGTPLGDGLTTRAAQELGLRAGTPVGAGLIDAHAGGIGSVGCGGDDPCATMAYVFGTSSCTMTTVKEPVFVPGIWGPYQSAMIPDLWLLEGGQSAAGAAIDRLLSLHPAHGAAEKAARSAGQSLPIWLGERACEMAGSPAATVMLARGLHVVPEFLGNRTPFADPHSRALIAGLGMDQSVDSLVAQYIAGLCGIAYGLRQIIETQTRMGAKTASIAISGGAGRSALAQQLIADATGLPVLVPACVEPVLLGAAMLGAVAHEPSRDLREVMASMSGLERRVAPTGDTTRKIHDARYAVFLRLQSVGLETEPRSC